METTLRSKFGHLASFARTLGVAAITCSLLGGCAAEATEEEDVEITDDAVVTEAGTCKAKQGNFRASVKVAAVGNVYTSQSGEPVHYTVKVRRAGTVINSFSFETGPLDSVFRRNISSIKTGDVFSINARFAKIKWSPDIYCNMSVAVP